MLRRSRGFSLLFVITMLGVLSVGAALLLSASTDAGKSAGSHNKFVRGENVARAAVIEGADLLENLLYAAPDADLDLSRLRQLQPLNKTDAICIDGADCSQWLMLRQSLTVASSGTNNVMRVAVTCNPGGCATAAKAIVNFQIRSVGTFGGQKTPLVEVTLVPTDAP